VRLSDVWVWRLGALTLAAFLGGPILGFILMDRVPAWVAAGCGFGLPALGLAVAFVAMTAHQATSGLSDDDLAAWERRGEHSRSDPTGKGGPFLVFLPFVYLLAGPEQRRLARYQRRTARRRARRRP
jgi:hypothetical protein